MSKIYTQHEAKYYFARQTTWGTAVTSNMRQLNCEPVAFSPDIKVRRVNRSYAGRIRPREAHLVDSKGSAPGATFRGIARREDLTHMVFATLQDLTAQSGTTPNFQKTFKFPATVPDFAVELDGTSNINLWAGTFLKTSPEGNRGQEFHDAVTKDLILKWKQGQGPETRVMYDWSVIGRGAMGLAQAAPGGTDVVAPEAHYDYYDINVATIEGVDMVILEAELAIRTNVFIVGVDKANDGKFYNFGYGVPDVDFKLKCAWTTEANDVQAAIGSETDHSWVISFGTSGQQGFLQFNAEMQPGEDTTDDEGGGQTKAIDIVGKLIKPTATTNWYDSMSIVICDDNDFTTSI